jgi:AcrR family transcriptional regulator
LLFRLLSGSAGCATFGKRNRIPYLYGTLFRLSSRILVSDESEIQGGGPEPRAGARRVRADAQRNLDTLLRAALAVFATSGVDAPVREIAEKAGVGIGTVYRHFPERADLIAAVFRREIDDCADAAPILAAEHEAGEALARWLQRFAAFIAAKRGLSAALHSGDPAFDGLPAHFEKRLRPALRTLVEAAKTTGAIRADVDANDLLSAVASLCTPAYDKDSDYARRMVALLVDGLRFGAGAQGSGASRG